MTKTNKKGRKLLDDVNAEWQRREMNMDDFKKGAQSFIGQIKGQSTGQQDWSTGDFQKKKQSGWLKKRGIFDAVDGTTATPEQIAQRKKKDAKAKVAEAKRLAKRQRGSATLKKRKSEVPEYLKKLEELKKYKKGFAILYAEFRYEITHRNPILTDENTKFKYRGENYIKLKKLGLVK